MDRLRYLIAAVVVSVLAAAPVLAGGTDEEPGHDHERDHEHAEELPELSAADLDTDEKLRVVATTSIIADVVSNVGKDAIDLSPMMKAGENPHSYQPAPSELAAVERAHVVFVNGFGLEEGLLDDIENAARGAIVPVSAGIEPLSPSDAHEHEDHEGEDHEGEDHGDEDHHEHDHGAVDPHVWFSPANVMHWVENIEHALSELDPRNAADYHANAESYSEKLNALDASIRSKLASVPEEDRVLVTDHQLFTYFARDFNFTVIGAIVPGTSTSAEASARQVAELIELLKEHDVRTIYVGATAGRGLGKLADSIASEVGGDVRIISVLTGSLSRPGAEGDTYIDYMEYNVSQIMRGFQ